MKICRICKGTDNQDDMGYRTQSVVMADKAYVYNYYVHRSCERARLDRWKARPGNRQRYSKLLDRDSIKWPYKRRARQAARKLPKQPCEVCGATENIHKHHDDYSKPLEVRYFCALHHRQHHALIRAEAQTVLAL